MIPITSSITPALVRRPRYEVQLVRISYPSVSCKSAGCLGSAFSSAFRQKRGVNEHPRALDREWHCPPHIAAVGEWRRQTRRRSGGRTRERGVLRLREQLSDRRRARHRRRCRGLVGHPPIGCLCLTDHDRGDRSVLRLEARLARCRTRPTALPGISAGWSRRRTSHPTSQSSTSRPFLERVIRGGVSTATR
jgi:hypothetical protein